MGEGAGGGYFCLDSTHSTSFMRSFQLSSTASAVNLSNKGNPVVEVVSTKLRKILHKKESVIASDDSGDVYH